VVRATSAKSIWEEFLVFEKRKGFSKSLSNRPQVFWCQETFFVFFFFFFLVLFFLYYWVTILITLVLLSLGTTFMDFFFICNRVTFLNYPVLFAVVENLLFDHHIHSIWFCWFWIWLLGTSIGPNVGDGVWRLCWLPSRLWGVLFSFFPLKTILYSYLFSSFDLLLLQCGSGRSVAPIKAGFVARVGRRTAGT